MFCRNVSEDGVVGLVPPVSMTRIVSITWR